MHLFRHILAVLHKAIIHCCSEWMEIGRHEHICDCKCRPCTHWSAHLYAQELVARSITKPLDVHHSDVCACRLCMCLS